MRTLIFALIIASFLQSTFLNLNLVLIILICRAFLIVDRTNLILTFFFGLLISHLNLHPLGLESVTFLILVQITHLLSKSPLTRNGLLIIPTFFILSLINEVVLSFILGYSIQLFPKVLIESILSAPALFIVRLWEERFIVRKDMKLKI